MAEVNFDVQHICCVSNKDERHYAISDPVKLKCGHFACRKCCKELTEKVYLSKDFYCVFCENKNNVSLLSDPDSTYFESLEKNFLNIKNEIDLTLKNSLDMFEGL